MPERQPQNAADDAEPAGPVGVPGDGAGGDHPDVPREELESALHRAAGGDERAWRWIVDRYARRVFGLLHAQCGEAETAEELTQSTFCTVVTKIGEYTEQGRFEAWLFRIAMNRLRDEMRRRRRHAVPVEHDTLAGLVGEQGPAAGRGGAGGGGTGGDIDLEEIGALREALARLPEADRLVIHLRHAAGMSFKGIGEYLGQPLGTVLARHHRALRKLREDLTPGPEGSETSSPAGSRSRGEEIP
jgi:RNA polymerase sigma-70 factor (ECF subfamily)